MSPRPWRETPEGVSVTVRVTPRGGRDALDGLDRLADGKAVLKIRVRRAPEAGAANEAVRRLLAEALGMPASGVRLRAGATSRLKTFALSGDSSALAVALARLCPSGTTP